MTSRGPHLGILFLAVATLCAAQGPAVSQPLLVGLTADETLHYEIEGSASYSASVMDGYTTNPPLGPCQYAFSTVVSLRVSSANASGNTPVKAAFQDAKVTSWNCIGLSQKRVEKTLQRLSTSPLSYEVGPHGEVSFHHHVAHQFDDQSASDLLNKTVLDLLQTRLADRPVALGSSWKPHGQFIYEEDARLNGLELSAASLRWKSSPQISGRNCGLIVSRYVFAPTESSAGPITAGGSLRQSPTNVLAGLQEVSLLFDLDAKRIAWLQRYYKVENNVSVQPEEEPDPEVLNIRWEEQSKARFIPERESVAWLAALKKFESAPHDVPSAISKGSSESPSLAEMARTAVPRKKPTFGIDTLDFTPEGFTRWDNKFCNSPWYCIQVSIALPANAKVADDSDLQRVYLAKTGGAAMTVTLGPPLTRQHAGLTADEELRKQTDFFIANQLWMSNKPGIGVESQSLYIDGYPARMVAFRGQRQDLAETQGLLALLASPWGESFPVTCTVNSKDFAKMKATCERILGLIKMTRPEP